MKRKPTPMDAHQSAAVRALIEAGREMAEALQVVGAFDHYHDDLLDRWDRAVVRLRAGKADKR